MRLIIDGAGAITPDARDNLRLLFPAILNNLWKMDFRTLSRNRPEQPARPAREDFHRRAACSVLLQEDGQLIERLATTPRRPAPGRHPVRRGCCLG